MENCVVIGIAGGTASGKTTLVEKLKEILQDEVATLCHDYYYKANEKLEFEKRKMLNYDHPDAFDTEMLIMQLQELRDGKAIQAPQYDFVNHTRKKDTITIEPKKVIIVEGILIFENRELRQSLDINVFVDTDADVRIIRRIVRDVNARGRSLDNVIEQYLNTVKLMHEEFVEPSKRYADIIIPQGGYNKVALNMLVDRIKNLLKS